MNTELRIYVTHCSAKKAIKREYTISDVSHIDILFTGLQLSGWSEAVSWIKLKISDILLMKLEHLSSNSN